MSTLDLITKAEAAGVALSAQGDRLAYRGPREAVRRLLPLLAQHKAELLAALSKAGPKHAAPPSTPAPVQAPPEPERAAWTGEDWRTYFDERAGIREYDGQRPRAEAERLAWGETLDAWRKAHWAPPPAWQCAGCGKPLSGSPIMDLWDGACVHDTQDYACLIAYGRRWRSAATAALRKLGLSEPPSRLKDAS